jgi:hypothetical protein
LLLPVDDVPGGLLDAGGGGDDEVLDDDDALVPWFFGFDEVADAAAGADGVLVQPAAGVDVVCAWAAGLALGLELCAAGVAVLVTVMVTVALAVTVIVSVGLAVPVALSLADAVLCTAGGVELLDFVTFCAAGACELAVDDRHGVAGGGTMPLADSLTCDAPAPFTEPPPAGCDGPDGTAGEPNPTEVASSERIVGTVASTTPTANTAKPTAKAGRSIASRQSRGRCGAGRACPGFALRAVGAAGRPRSTRQRRIRAARNPELAAARASLAVA